MGDFNMPDIDWYSMSASTLCSEMFCDSIVDTNLYQLVDKPSHIRGNILDLILSDHPEHISDTTILDQTFSSDHYLVTIVYSTHSCSTVYHDRTTLSTKLNWDKADWLGLSYYLLNVDFSSCCVTDNIDNSWSLLKDIILDACSKFIPLHKSRKFNHPPWYTPHIVHSIKKIRSLRRLIKSKHSPAITCLSKLKMMETNLLSDMAEAKEAYQLHAVGIILLTFSQDFIQTSQ